MNVLRTVFKVLLIIFIVGVVLFVALFAASGFDTDMISGVEYITNEYEIGEEFSDIYIDVSSADVKFAISDTDSAKVVCRESNKVKINASVDDNKLVVVSEENWYDFIFGAGSGYYATVYIPAGEYGTLYCDVTTGDLSICDGVSFATANIDVTTGDVNITCDVAGDVILHVTTGDVKISGVEFASLNMDCTTSDVYVDNASVSGACRFDISTGDTVLTGLRAESAEIDTTTGEVVLNDVILNGKLQVECTTGDVILGGSDAKDINIKCTSGDVIGTLLTPKTFSADSTSGDVKVQFPSSGDPCVIRTTSGDIHITIVEAN